MAGIMMQMQKDVCNFNSSAMSFNNSKGRGRTIIEYEIIEEMAYQKLDLLL